MNLIVCYVYITNCGLNRCKHLELSLDYLTKSSTIHEMSNSEQFMTLKEMNIVLVSLLLICFINCSFINISSLGGGGGGRVSIAVYGIWY